MANVAVFDLDGTIVDGDMFVAYARHVLLRRPWRLGHCFGLIAPAVGFALGRVSNDVAKQRLLNAVAGGATRAEVARWANSFAQAQLARMLKPMAAQRIASHAASGDLLVLATASLDLYAQEIGRVLGFDHVLATQALWHNDRLVCGLDGPNLRDAAKRDAVTALLARLDLQAARITAYSDHHSDLPLLRLADTGVAVDPTRKLADAAAGFGLQVEHWRKDG